MSRMELNNIQTKLKTAIQNHQMLVVKIKGDSQNVTLKKGLLELQEEIKRLSDEQKKIVVKLRESLVKPQNHTPLAPVLGSEGTMTSIGQQVLNFPSQGAGGVLPVSMLAVPIAHMQQPAVSMYLHSASGVPLSPATSISLMPASILASGCSIINSEGTISLANNLNNLLHGNIALNTFDNGFGSLSNAQFTSSGSTSSGFMLSNANSTNQVGSNITALVPGGNIIQTSLTNGVGLITSNNNGSTNSDVKATVGHSSASVKIVASCNVNSINLGHPTSSGITNVNLSQPASTSATNVNPSQSGVIAAALHSAPSTVSSVGSVLPQQPLVQPHLLQQQQQQILQMIQQQQQQPHQRLASHLPIKVPQYSASHIRPGNNITQNGSVTSSPGIVTTAHSIKVASSLSVPIFPKCTSNTELSVHDSILTSAVSTKVVPDTHKTQTHSSQVTVKQREDSHRTSAKSVSDEEEKKIQFMEKLDLFTSSALNDLVKRRNERKRRTTANPHYSFGFEMSNRDGAWNSSVTKRQRVRGHSQPEAQQQKQLIKKLNDNHDDFCAACHKGGELLMCETCRLVYHLDCLNPPLTHAPTYAWSCPKCLVLGKGLTYINNEVLARVHNYINFKTAKVEEKKLIEKKNSDLISERNNLEARLKHLNDKIVEKSLLQSNLSSQDMKKKEELHKLSDFVKSMKESSPAETLPIPSGSCLNS
uniref:PHD-type domain-containing protein n=2 Tax=Biomphalaria glabrata TaxID=6526 RepID=A0A2C9M4J0_BIOGL